MTKRRGAPIEWIGGNMMMPAPADGSEPLETFFWLNAQGDLLGTATYAASDMAERIGDSFVATTESPAVGEPHVPARIRVESAEHAAALRGAVGPETEVVCAPTPEAEPVRISLAAYLEKVGSVDDETYLSSGLEPEAVGRFFREVARLHGVAPWTTIADDPTCASVTIKALGVRDASLVVVGNDGSIPGFLLFPNEASAAEYRRMDEEGAMDLDDEDSVVPPHIAVMFVRGAELEPARRKEIVKHGWKVAGPAAYPEIGAFDEDGLPRPVTARELAAMEAVAHALAEVVETKPDVVRAIVEERTFDAAVEVETSRGKVTVALGPPSDDATGGFGGFDDEEDEEARAAASELLERFRASPEAKRLKEHHDWSGLLLDHTRAFIGAQVEELTPVIVEEAVFSSFPEKVACPPEVAGSIVDELRAFFAFLEREGLCPEAAACARLFDGGAEKKLQDRLADPRSFGVVKTMVMAGIEAGFDLSTEEGLNAWLGTAAEALGSGDESGARSERGPRKPAAKTEKKQAARTKPKAQRATRKKNR